ncbi:MAG: hypothetical protein C0467_00750 [Planctomycetaceae bacterium]|nr:hypothetical protein [Planctomycetaceae bacterium]
MFRLAFAITAVALHLVPVVAEDKKPTVNLGGSIEDEKLQKEAPANGVIVSEKGWEALVKAWGIKDAPKVDFTKELLVVGTWNGSIFQIRTMVQDGDLTIDGPGSADKRPGFRWKVVSISREGIKTIQSKELPKE